MDGLWHIVRTLMVPMPQQEGHLLSKQLLRLSPCSSLTCGREGWFVEKWLHGCEHLMHDCTCIVIVHSWTRISTYFSANLSMKFVAVRNWSESCVRRFLYCKFCLWYCSFVRHVVALICASSHNLISICCKQQPQKVSCLLWMFFVCFIVSDSKHYLCCHFIVFSLADTCTIFITFLVNLNQLFVLFHTASPQCRIMLAVDALSDTRTTV